MCERFTESQKKECNGGQGCCIYKAQDERIGSDKPDHMARSLVNQPNHRKFWNKQNDLSKLQTTN